MSLEYLGSIYAVSVPHIMRVSLIFAIIVSFMLFTVFTLVYVLYVTDTV